MKTFLKWMEQSHEIEGWDNMPRAQRELISYHRGAEAYKQSMLMYKNFLEELLGELEKTMMCGGIADKYRYKLKGVEGRVQGMLAKVPPPL